MSNDSDEPPQRAIRRMISTVETIQSLFPDLWASDDPQETLSNEGTGQHGLDSRLDCVQQPHTAVPIKQSDASWPCARVKDSAAPESSHRAMSRLMSTVAINQLLFPELWDPIDKVPQDILLRNIQPVKQQDTPESIVTIEPVDQSEGEDSSDSGIYSETYLA